MTFTTVSIALALATQAAPQASSQSGSPAATDSAASQLTLEQAAAIKCAAALAVASSLQQKGEEEADRYPPLGERGREFFVRTIAKLMDDTSLSREQLSERLVVEAERFQDRKQLDETMPACLLMLDAAGL